MNNNLDMTSLEPRAWWFVRPTLIAALATLISLLVLLLSRPEFLERSIAGF